MKAQAVSVTKHRGHSGENEVLDEKKMLRRAVVYRVSRRKSREGRNLNRSQAQKGTERNLLLRIVRKRRGGSDNIAQVRISQPWELMRLSCM